MNRNRITTIILIIAFLAGLCLLLYPQVSDYWNSFHQTRAITKYVSAFESMDESVYEAVLKEAESYNRTLSHRRGSSYVLSESQAEEYARMLNISGDSMMGYIEIPVIGVSLPIFHGSSEIVLQSSVGHLEWTSLPVGGVSSHCVLTGHRGLPSSRLFTDLDKLVEGDTFIIQVLNKTMTYEVDQILIVEPKAIESLEIAPGEDFVTLMTCTPYAINTHRLLVRGHRIENELESSAAHVTADAVPVEPMLVALSFFAILILIALVAALLPRSTMRNKKAKHN